jgi:hypothetical protein
MQQLNDTKIITYNHAGLSVWQQLKQRPRFLNAFKAMNEMKNRFDPYYRYFTYNIYLMAYNNINNLANSVFFGLSAASQ